MNMVSRRGVIAGGAAAFGLLVIGGGLLKFIHIFGKHYPPTPYDDLLAGLADREAAALTGKAVRSATSGFNAKATAAMLRAELRTRDLGTLIAGDAAAGKIADAGGWIMPQSLGQLCALAAG